MIPSAPHANVVPNTCAGCHMQTVAATSFNGVTNESGFHQGRRPYLQDELYEQPRAPRFRWPMSVPSATAPSPTLIYRLPITTVTASVQGVQTEVQHLLDKLSTLLPPSTYQANPANYVADGLVKSRRIRTSRPTGRRNSCRRSTTWQFVANDNSFGVHNAAVRGRSAQGFHRRPDR